ncbi:hypothetical protein C5Y96_10820 [Blastopirellula marina]|uniref:Uncharacterized protein n=1 Tax=Blastopirellula marina TaxID=124 RepID=A0A2S8FMD7_9BACT|nr:MULTISPECIES: hypothetical protein [Pirellulaceae]PQO33336.1 hypothetical protein C5Y96_10820 [Blastopirellula marina]RCS52425.1 hypothetical protein DTL36_10830 [Bremerella cremea]
MAICIWRGDAQGVAQVDKVTVDNVEVGDTFTLTINRKTVSFTATAGTPESVYQGLSAAIAAAAIAEFPSAAAVAATDSVAAHLRLTGLADGTPFVVTGTTNNGGTAEVAVEVLRSGGNGVNMIQQVSLPAGLASGTFTLSFEGQTTGNLTLDESAADIETALKALSNIGSSDVTVSGPNGGPWLVEFTGTLAATTQTLLTGNGASLAGQSVSVTTTTTGQPGDNHRLKIVGTQALSETVPIGFSLMPNEPDATASGTVHSAQTDAQWLSLLAHVYGLASSSSLSLVRTSSTTATTRTYTIEVEIVAEKAGHAVLAPTVARSTIITYDLDAVVSHTIVSNGGNSTNEVQAVTLPGNPSGGTFTLSFQGQTTGNLTFDESAADVEAALEALSNIASGAVSVTGDDGGPWTIEFTGTLAGTDVGQMTASGANLTGGTVTISTVQAAVANQNEQALLTMSASVTSGTFTLTYDESESTNIPYNATSASVKSALQSTASIGSGDVNVSGPAGGPWLVEFIGSLAGQNVTAITSNGTNLVGAGTQSLTISPLITPTGPAFWDNAANWSTSSVPTDGDTAILEASDRPVLYGLNQSSVTLAALLVRGSFVGTIGLPHGNQAGYLEYRDTHLRISASSVRIGEGAGSGSERIRLDLGSGQTDVTVAGSASPAALDEYAVNVLGTHAANVLRIYRGSVSSAQYAGQAAVWASVQVGYADDPAGDVELLLGDNAAVGSLIAHGGQITCFANSGSDITSLLVTAGSVVIGGTDGIAQLDIEGGNVFYHTTGTLGGNTVVGGSGTLSFEGDLRDKTVTNAITCRGDAANVLDPQGVVADLTVHYQSTSRFPELGTNFTAARS